MNHPLLAAALALGAAALAAIGSIMRQQATQRTGGIDRTWAIGAVVALGAFGLQLAALVLGTVLLVQPLIVLSVLFELLIQMWWTRLRPSGVQWRNAVLVAGGVGVFIAFARPVPARIGPQEWILDLVILCLFALLIVLYLIARRRSGTLSAVLFGTISGSLFGLVSVQINSLTNPFRGVVPTLATVTFWACLVAIVLAVLAQQRSFAKGALEASYPAMVAGEPVVAIVLSMAVLGEKFSSHALGSYVGIAGLLAMIVGVIGLARATARTEIELGSRTAGSDAPLRDLS